MFLFLLKRLKEQQQNYPYVQLCKPLYTLQESCQEARLQQQYTTIKTYRLCATSLKYYVITLHCKEQAKQQRKEDSKTGQGRK